MNDSKRSKKYSLGERPHYYHGQLLLEDDFRAEQRYHTDALRHHNLRLHDWGVAAGLSVSCHGESIQIGRGLAIDSSGRELVVETPTNMSVAGFGPNAELTVSLAYEEGSDGSGEAETPQRTRIQCYAVLSLQRREMPEPEVLLAIVRLDEEGRASPEANDNLYRGTRYARVLAPGSIKASHLHESLRRGWLRLPFRPDPILPPEKGGTSPPPFLIGETQTMSKSPHAEGAGGTMAIPLPAGVTRIIQLRIAGEDNKGKIDVQLFKGGWNSEEYKHSRDILLSETFDGPGPFNKTFPIAQDSCIDPEYHTLSLLLQGTQKTSISLVAIEYEYS